VAAIHSPSKNLFLYQYWEEYDGLTCLMSGGLNKAEDELTALKREIDEETGLENYTITGILGSDIITHYKSKSGINYKKVITPYLVTLEDHEAHSTNKEADEKFENKFSSYEAIQNLMDKYEEKSGSTLKDHKIILDRANNYTSSNLLN
jgi:8-oxo-dGTP pyrophosphatase MutT (NUDIX family)